VEKESKKRRRGSRFFRLGQLVATPGALAAIGASGRRPFYLSLPAISAVIGGDVDEHDRKENQLSLEQGYRLISVYTLSITGVKFLGDYRGRPFVYLYFAAPKSIECRNETKGACLNAKQFQGAL